MIRVQVARRTKAALQQMADRRCRTLSNLCLLALLERDRVGNLRLGNDEGTPWAASAPVSRDPKTARINIRCHRQLKENIQHQAKTSGQTLSAYCNHLFERFTEAAELTRVAVPDLSLWRRGG